VQIELSVIGFIFKIWFKAGQDISQRMRPPAANDLKLFRSIVAEPDVERAVQRIKLRGVPVIGTRLTVG
jgi:hypothetical protein